jgi:hypothetical protein
MKSCIKTINGSYYAVYLDNNRFAIYTAPRYIDAKRSYSVIHTLWWRPKATWKSVWKSYFFDKITYDELYKIL